MILNFDKFSIKTPHKLKTSITRSYKRFRRKGANPGTFGIYKKNHDPPLTFGPVVFRKKSLCFTIKKRDRENKGNYYRKMIYQNQGKFNGFCSFLILAIYMTVK